MSQIRSFPLVCSIAMGLSLGSTAGADGLGAATLDAEIVPLPSSDVNIDWTGFYAGGSLGYERSFVDQFFSGCLDIVNEDGDIVGGSCGSGINVLEADTLTVGLHLGYNHDFGRLVLGGELEASAVEFPRQTYGFDTYLRAKIRAGYDLGRFLPYAVGGAAVAEVVEYPAGKETFSGWLYGAGMDYRWSDNVTVGVEYLRHNFEGFSIGRDSSPQNRPISLSLRVSYNF